MRQKLLTWEPIFFIYQEIFILNIIYIVLMFRSEVLHFYLYVVYVILILIYIVVV